MAGVRFVFRAVLYLSGRRPASELLGAVGVCITGIGLLPPLQ